ncbi:MAG: ABC transporter ATP-binding protein [Coriobacteriia bacterium]|nr:ABC transporter ATP-binding protein [Coriobacteriia bacterium]
MISYSNVTKAYGEIVAVSGLNLEIRTGEFFGLLGPNGAGKTTIMRMTATLTPLTTGQITIDGQPISRNLVEVKQKIGVVPQYSNLEGELTARENLEYHGRLYGLGRNERKQRIDELLEFSELTERRNDPAKNFSGGMQRKLMIAKTLMHDPEILLLDEPTVGLDASTRRRIWDFLRQVKAKGLTIFLTTHYLEEAQMLCERVGLIDEGRLVLADAPDKVIQSVGQFVLEYFVDGHTNQEFFMDKDTAIAAAQYVNGDIKVRETNLEDVFIKMTNKDLGVRNEI